MYKPTINEMRVSPETINATHQEYLKDLSDIMNSPGSEAVLHVDIETEDTLNYKDLHFTASSYIPKKRGESTEFKFSVCGFEVESALDYNRIVSPEGSLNMYAAALYVQRRTTERSLKVLSVSGSALYQCSHFHKVLSPRKPIPAWIKEVYPNPQYHQPYICP